MEAERPKLIVKIKLPKKLASEPSKAKLKKPNEPKKAKKPKRLTEEARRAKIEAGYCPVCGKKYSRSENLSRHMWDAHGEQMFVPKPVECDICDFTAANSSSLERHKKLVHQKRRPKRPNTGKFPVLDPLPEDTGGKPGTYPFLIAHGLKVRFIWKC